MKARKPEETLRLALSLKLWTQCAPHPHQSACLATSCQGQNLEHHWPGVRTSSHHAAPPHLIHKPKTALGTQPYTESSDNVAKKAAAAADRTSCRLHQCGVKSRGSQPPPPAPLLHNAFKCKGLHILCFEDMIQEWKNFGTQPPIF